MAAGRREIDLSHGVAVIGAGIVGLSTAKALRDRGIKVTVFESGQPGNGQSGGEARIFRHAHDDPRLVEFTRDGRAIWREWQEDWGVELVSRGGVVALGDSALDRLAVIETVEGVEAERIESSRLNELLPLLAPFEGPAVLDPDGGSIRTTAAIDALVKDLGSALVKDEVISIEPADPGGVEVRSGNKTGRFSVVVVCAGRNTAALAGTVGLEIPVSLEAHVRLTFQVRGGAISTDLACLQDSSGEFGETGIYGAPLPGNDRFALGLSDTVDVSPAGAIADPAQLAELAARASAYVERAMPDLEPDPVGVKHCWVTMLPWSDDGFAVWNEGPAYFVAGHNLFKQAPAIGRALAKSVMEGEVPDFLGPAAKLGEPAG